MTSLKGEASREAMVVKELKSKDSRGKDSNNPMEDRTHRRPYPSSRARASRLRVLVRARVCAGVRLVG